MQHLIQNTSQLSGIISVHQKSKKSLHHLSPQIDGHGFGAVMELLDEFYWEMINHLPTAPTQLLLIFLYFIGSSFKKRYYFRNGLHMLNITLLVIDYISVKLIQATTKTCRGIADTFPFCGGFLGSWCVIAGLRSW